MSPVCVVDDDRAMCELIEAALQPLGLTVFTFTRPEPALEHVRNHEVSVVLTDVRMPGMSGQEFVRRQRETGSDIPVVVLSGSSEAKQVGRELGAIAVIHKPFDLDELVRIVKRVTD